MKIAIVQDWFEKHGGAEWVVENLLIEFPEADVWTLWDDSNISESTGVNVHTSFMQRLPSRFRRPVSVFLAPMYWRWGLPSREYDVVVCCSHQFAHMANFGSKKAFSIGYFYTPCRYVWFPELDRRLSKPGLNLWRQVLRILDRRWSNVTQRVAISQSVSERIQRVWNSPSTVIYPPVRLKLGGDQCLESVESDPYFISFGRLIDYKNHQMAIRKSAELGFKLVIAGSGPLEAELRELAHQLGAQVSFHIAPSDQEVVSLIRGARALLFLGEEDFGIVPLEATALGTPVIALAKSGALETVVSGVSGRLFSTESEFDQLILEFDVSWNETVIETHLAKFEPASFRNSFRNLLG